MPCIHPYPSTPPPVFPSPAAATSSRSRGASSESSSSSASTAVSSTLTSSSSFSARSSSSTETPGPFPGEERHQSTCEDGGKKIRSQDAGEAKIETKESALTDGGTGRREDDDVDQEGHRKGVLKKPTKQQGPVRRLSFKPPSPQPHRSRVIGVLKDFVLVEVDIQGGSQPGGEGGDLQGSARDGKSFSQTSLVSPGGRLRDGNTEADSEREDGHTEKRTEKGKSGEQEDDEKEGETKERPAEEQESFCDDGNAEHLEEKGEKKKTIVGLLPIEEFGDILRWVYHQEKVYVHRNTFTYGLGMKGKKPWDGFRAAQDQKTGRNDEIESKMNT